MAKIKSVKGGPVIQLAFWAVILTGIVITLTIGGLLIIVDIVKVIGKHYINKVLRLFKKGNTNGRQSNSSSS